jgi:hypothetical protein
VEIRGREDGNGERTAKQQADQDAQPPMPQGQVPQILVLQAGKSD